MTIAQSWTNAQTLADLETIELQQTIKDGATTLLHVLSESMLRNDMPLNNLDISVTNTYIDNIVQNICIEIARRKMAYDRMKLKFFEFLSIKDLIKENEYPEIEFIRAYLMRRREETGEELTEGDLEKVKIIAG